MADGVAVVIFEKSDVFIALHRLAQRDPRELVIELVDHGDLAFGYLENARTVGRFENSRHAIRDTDAACLVGQRTIPQTGEVLLVLRLASGVERWVTALECDNLRAIGGGPPDARKIGLTGGGKGCKRR